MCKIYRMFVVCAAQNVDNFFEPAHNINICQFVFVFIIHNARLLCVFHR